MTVNSLESLVKSQRERNRIYRKIPARQILLDGFRKPHVIGVTLVGIFPFEPKCGHLYNFKPLILGIRFYANGSKIVFVHCSGPDVFGSPRWRFVAAGRGPGPRNGAAWENFLY